MTISLPAAAHKALMITVTDTGQLVGFEWQGAGDISPADKAAIIALETARMFSGGNLRLTALIALWGDCERLHNEACTVGSRYEEKYGFSDTDESLRIASDIDAACDREIRARQWVASYPCKDGIELAQKVLALVDSTKLSSGLAFPERLALRADALRVAA